MPISFERLFQFSAKVFSGSLLLCSLILSDVGIAGAFETGTMAEMTLYNHIRPSVARMGVRAKALESRMESLCDEKSSATLHAVRQEFRSALDGWSRLEHLRFGPLVEESRYERLAYWPDRKGLGIKQVRRALLKRDASVLDVSSLSKKSVALQGLTALEYILFGKGADTLAAASPQQDFRCRFGLAVSRNIAAIASAVEKAWWQEDGYSNLLLNPGADNPVYRSEKEVKLELFKVFTSGLQNVEELKLLKPLGSGIATARPKRAAFWRSRSSTNVIIANIASLSEMFVHGGFSALIDQATEGKSRIVVSILKNAERTMKSVKLPFAEAVKDKDERAKIKFVRSVVGSVRGKAGAMIALAADLSIGFRAGDGD